MTVYFSLNLEEKITSIRRFGLGSRPELSAINELVELIFRN